MQRHRIIAVLIAILALTGCWELGQGAYIFLKAQLAQVLMKQAWADSLRTRQPVKPWSWADTWPVARLAFPKQKVDLIILAGDSGRNLAFGPGYQFGSAFPGRSGNSIISAHRDTHFEFLQHVALNDIMQMQTLDNRTIMYRVDDIEIIDIGEHLIALDSDVSTLTLLTCYPFDAVRTGGPLRYKITLHEISKSVDVTSRD